MSKTAIITTERTYMGTPEDLDFSTLRKLDMDPEIMKYINKGKPRSEEESRKWLQTRLAEYKENGFGLMPAHLKTNGDFIGWAGLKHLDKTKKIEVGYRLAKDFWGKGFATELTKAIIAYARDQFDFKELVAVTDLENTASKNVLIKNGFTHIGEAFYYDNTVDYFELKL